VKLVRQWPREIEWMQVKLYDADSETIFATIMSARPWWEQEHNYLRYTGCRLKASHAMTNIGNYQ
jgi:hypothetical protein